MALKMLLNQQLCPERVCRCLSLLLCRRVERIHKARGLVLSMTGSALARRLGAHLCQDPLILGGKVPQHETQAGTG